MSIEYAKSTLAESVIPVKDYKITSSVVSGKEVFGTVKFGDVVQIVPGSDTTAADRGKARPILPTTFGVVTTPVTNLGVSEGTNFEGLEQQRTTAKVRSNANAIYVSEYGTINTTTGAFTEATIDTSLLNTERAIGKSANGFVVTTTTTTPAVKIIDIDVAKKKVYFQFLSSTIV